MRRYLWLGLTALGFLAILAGRLYHLRVHPEWTEAEAMINLWWVWLGGPLLAIFAIRRIK